MKHMITTTATTSASGVRPIRGLVLGASPSSRGSERELSGWFSCGGSSTACRRTSCSRVHVRGLAIRESMNDLPSYLKFITKSFLKWCRNRFVFVCYALVLFMCCHVGAGSSAGSSARAYERGVRLKSTGKIIFLLLPHICVLHCHQNNVFFSFFFFLFLFYDVQKKFFVRNIFLNGCATSFLVTLRSSLTMNISNFFFVFPVFLLFCFSLFPPQLFLFQVEREQERERDGLIF